MDITLSATAMARSSYAQGDRKGDSKGDKKGGRKDDRKGGRKGDRKARRVVPVIPQAQHVTSHAHIQWGDG